MASSTLTRYCPQLLDAPAQVVNLALEGDLEIRKQHDFVWPFLTGQEGVVWAEVGERAVGCQVWTVKQDGRMWWYEVSYVLPEFRKQGILAEIRKRVRELAAADPKVRFIEYFIRPDNEDMLKSIEKVGMTPSNFHYRYLVKKQEE